MSKLVLLDSGPLGWLTNTNDPPASLIYRHWATDLRRKGATLRIPEIIDYELRRELIRLNSGESLAELDLLIQTYGYEPLCTDAMRLAAQLWAEARTVIRKRTAQDNELDGDVILCAQARLLIAQGLDVWVATENVGHLGLFLKTARLWNEIEP